MSQAAVYAKRFRISGLVLQFNRMCASEYLMCVLDKRVTVDSVVSREGCCTNLLGNATLGRTIAMRDHSIHKR